jgi:diguanylate cyclase (GGDEF)-like protein
MRVISRIRWRPAHRHRHALGLTRRFQLVLVVLVIVLGGVGWAGLSGLAAADHSLGTMYQTNVTDQQAVTSLTSRLDDTKSALLEGWVTTDSRSRARLAQKLIATLLPETELAVSNLHEFVSGNPQEAEIAKDMAAQWAAFETLWSEGQWGNGRSPTRASRVSALTNSLGVLTAATDEINALENADGTRSVRQARLDGSSSRQTMILVLALGVLASLAAVLWLTRAVLPRVLSFARYAGRIAHGDYGERLEVRGGDELGDLGRTLDDVAARRQEAEEFERTQTEFSDSLQLIGDEREAQDLVRRHLERSIPTATVTVFNKNNSADRLEPVTRLAADSPLASAMRGASPRDCLAVRGAMTYTETPEHEPLLGCRVCSGCPGNKTCSPLLVGGEVIGALLIQHENELDDAAVRRMRESVGQAAPVIANLRNLAIAQLRAATDALTGLPNRRALDDMIKRMVAQSHQANTPLAALMLDLDHFKRANDTFGHSKGDEILAALGASLPNWIRRTDFAARYGGEEFLVLLPETDLPGALIIAEKIRSAVADIRLTGLELDLSASVGVAVLPHHAIDSEQLVRAADRALYAAKTNGRNRVEVASEPAALASESAMV